MKMKEKNLNFFDNQPPTRHIKSEAIDFAPSKKLIIVTMLPSANLEWCC